MAETMTRRDEDVGRIGELIAVSDKRFDAVDKRFAAVDKRFDDMNARFTTLTWLIGVGFVVITSLTTVFALLA